MAEIRLREVVQSRFFVRSFCNRRLSYLHTSSSGLLTPAGLRCGPSKSGAFGLGQRGCLCRTTSLYLRWR